MSDLISRAWEYVLWLTGPRPGLARYQSGTPATKQGLVVCMSLLADESKTNSQHHSELLSRLPLEVRRMIYDEILPSERLLWVRPVKAGDRKTGSLTEEAVITELFEHYPVASSAVDAVNSGYFGCGHEDWEAFWRCLDRGTLSFIHWDSIALMLSCKRVYLELFPLWTFCFNRLSDLEAFASCTATLGSALPLIRTVQFSPALPPCFTVTRAYHPEADLRREHASIQCRRHSEWWAAEVQRLSQVVQQLPGLATLGLDLGDCCALGDPAELLESLTVIEGVPAGTTLDAPPLPHPSGGLRVRWRRTREWGAGADDLITSTDCRFVIESELEWALDPAMAELELLPPDTETARLYT